MKKNSLVSALLLFNSFIAQGALLAVTGDSEFVAVGKPSALKIHGQGRGLGGELKVSGLDVDGQVKFPLNDFDTGVELRDHHLKEKYLETQKYPEALLQIAKMKLKSDPQIDGFKLNGFAFSGQLTLHGVTRNVTGTIDLSTSSGITKGEAKFELKISDFGINVPSYLGITVADTVEIKVHLEAKKVNG